MFFELCLEIGPFDVESEEMLSLVSGDGEKRHERGGACDRSRDACRVVVGAGALRETACTKSCLVLVECPVSVKLDLEDPFEGYRPVGVE